VAAVEEEQGGAGSSQRPRYEGYQQPQQQQQQPQQQAQSFQKKNVWINKNAGASAGQKKQWPKYTVGWPWTSLVCFTHFSRVSRQII
jgi:hypothetical protein